jgi:hypothetical protein
MIYLIITTSIYNKHGIVNFEGRKNRYIESIQSTLQHVSMINSRNPPEGYFIEPIIVENNGSRSTYLDNLGCPVLYTNNNNLHFPHKGSNELLDIKEVIHKYNIKDDDIIIKLTGRYKLLTPYFFNMIIEKSHNFEAFIKFFNVCTKKFMYDDCVLGLFAIQCKYLKLFNYDGIRSAECEFATYIRNMVQSNSLKLMEVENLELECCFADDLRKLIV